MCSVVGGGREGERRGGGEYAVLGVVGGIALWHIALVLVRECISRV